MMSMQARETFRPFIGTHHPLRVYPANSPRAKARLIALTLLADGRLADGELDALDRNGAFIRLGIARNIFFEVLADICADLLRLPAGKGNAVLASGMLAGLFAEIETGEDRTMLLQLIFELAHSDGTISGDEEILLQQAIENWTVPHGNRMDPYRLSNRPEHFYS